MPIEVMIIALAGISFAAFAIWMGHKQQLAKSEAEVAKAQSGPIAANQKQLEERVVVLERIITDQGYSVAQEIEQLRSEQNDSGTPLPKFNKEKELTE